MNCLELHTTVANLEEATAIATLAIEKNLAACAQLTHVESYFSWKNELEIAKEVKIVFKTTERQIEALKELIEEKSSYELPEIYYVEITGGSKEYLRWIDMTTLLGQS